MEQMGNLIMLDLNKLDAHGPVGWFFDTQLQRQAVMLEADSFIS